MTTPIPIVPKSQPVPYPLQPVTPPVLPAPTVPLPATPIPYPLMDHLNDALNIMGVPRPVVFKKAPTIAIIDYFNHASIDLNNDAIPDVSHGTTVGLYIRSRIPNANLLALDTTSPTEVKPPDNPFEFSLRPRISEFDSWRTHIRNVLNNVQQVEKLVKDGKTVDAVNISLKTVEQTGVITVERLAEVTGLPLTRENLKENKDKIRQSLSELHQNRDKGWLTERQKQYAQYWPVIESLDRLADLKIPVYISAGNTPESVNLYGLAKDVKLVGSQDDTGRTSGFSADNSLVNRSARGEYLAEPLFSPGFKVRGFDITGDGVEDIPADVVSGKGVLPFHFRPRLMHGTSYASPTALAQDLIQKEQERNGPPKEPKLPIPLPMKRLSTIQCHK